MIRCMKDEKIKKLEETLRSFDKPSLDPKSKSLIKSNLMSEIGRSNKVVSYIRSLVAQLDFGNVERAVIKENIFLAIEKTSQKSFIWERLFGFSKSFVSGCMVFFLVFGMFSFLTVDTRVTYAQTFTTLDTYFGNVLVKRDGVSLVLEEGMKLQEKDEIVTGDDGFAVVKYFDDSISRFASNTDVVINSLNELEKNSVNTYVEISLLEGTMWARVVNLVDDSSFVVKTSDLSTFTKRAGFNIEIQDEGAEVDVYNHSVEIEKAGKTQKIVSGQKVVAAVDIELEEINDDDETIAWVQDNIESDKEYLLEVEERLIAAKVESLDIDLEDEFSLDDSITEDVRSFMTFGDVNKAKLELDLAEKDFIAAELKSHDLDLTEKEGVNVTAARSVFSNEVEEFLDIIDEVSATDEEYAEELRVYVEDKILLYKKDSSLTEESDDVIEDLEILVANDEDEVAEVKLDQALDKLADVEDVLDEGDVEQASELVEKVGEDIDVLIDEGVDIEDAFDIKENLQKELEEKIKEEEALVEEEEVIEDSEAEIEDIEDEVVESVYVPVVVEKDPYGVEVQGDKPLPPFSSF